MAVSIVLPNRVLKTRAVDTSIKHSRSKPTTTRSIRSMLYCVEAESKAEICSKTMGLCAEINQGFVAISRYVQRTTHRQYSEEYGTQC